MFLQSKCCTLLLLNVDFSLINYIGKLNDEVQLCTIWLLARFQYVTILSVVSPNTIIRLFFLIPKDYKVFPLISIKLDAALVWRSRTTNYLPSIGISTSTAYFKTSTDSSNDFLSTLPLEHLITDVGMVSFDGKGFLVPSMQHLYHNAKHIYSYC